MNFSPALSLRLFIPFALGYFLSYLYRTVNAVLAPDLVRDLALDPAALGLLTSTYFLAFAAAQLPLGILLDRFGPRRVEAALLLFAATGALLFARANTLTELLMARALIGLGVSACLMAAFKAFTQWFPPEKLPFTNGIQMVSGGIGALAATVPVELALQGTDWRGVFLGLSGTTFAVAVIVFAVVPEKSAGAGRDTFRRQLAGIGEVFSSRAFWRITPWACASQASYQALVGLWAGPWLRDVAGFDRIAVANTLMGMAAAMIAGYFSLGALAGHLGRRGIAATRVASFGLTAFLLVQALLPVAPSFLTVPLWLLFGFLGTAGILPYAVLSQKFPGRLAGRVNTGLNLLVFLGAFLAQWCLGTIVGNWPATLAGGFNPAGYHWGIGLLVVLQMLAAGWYLLCGERKGA